MSYSFSRKILSLFLCIATLTPLFTACTGTRDTKEPLTDEQQYNMDIEMPIGFWVGPPPKEITTERYKEIKEAGFTFVTGFNESDGGFDTFKKALDCAQQNGLKCIINDPRIVNNRTADESTLKKFLDEYSNHPAYMGNLFMDEPSPSDYDWLSEQIKKYKNIVPKGLAYINLFPTYSSIQQRQERSYAEYLDEYFQKIKPEFLSYDHYPLRTVTSGSTSEISWDYFLNLQNIREKALKQKVPFWVFIQTLSIASSYRDPNEQEIRWQVNMSLAFGAKGIQYFTYWTPKGNGRENFGNAMIDPEGNKTNHYFEVQKINQEIKTIDHILMDLTSKGVVLHGDPKPEMPNELKEFPPITRIEGGAAVIGCFEDSKGNKKLMVVNQSYKEPCEISITFDKKSASKCSVRQQGEVEQIVLKKNKWVLPLSLEPGEGKLVDIIS